MEDIPTQLQPLGVGVTAVLGWLWAIIMRNNTRHERRTGELSRLHHELKDELKNEITNLKIQSASKPTFTDLERVVKVQADRLEIRIDEISKKLDRFTERRGND